MLRCLVNAMLISPCAAASTLHTDSGNSPLPRITTRDGLSVNADSCEPFVPCGFQYVRIPNNGIHYVHTSEFEAVLVDLSQYQRATR